MKRIVRFAALLPVSGKPYVRESPVTWLRQVSKSQKYLARTIATGAQTFGKDDGVIHSRLPPVDISHGSFRDLLMESFIKSGNNRAFIDLSSDRTYTYSNLKDAVIRVGSALTKLGYKKGDVISICALNSAEYMIISVAMIFIGGTVSVINPLATPDDLREHLLDCKARAIVTFPEFTPLVEKVKPALTNLKEVIVFGEAPGCRPFSALLNDDGSAFPDSIDINPVTDLVLLPYSSGTTGMPKGVMITHRNVTANIKQFLAAFPTTPADVMSCYLPLFHIFGMVTTLSGLVAGITCILMPRFDQNILSILEEYRVSIFNMVPPVCMFMVKHPNVQQTDLSSVRVAVSGAAAISKDLTERFQSATSIDNIIQGYGLTECPIVTMDIKPALQGSVGRLLPNTSAKVVDVSDGKVLGLGEKGEIWIRGPHVMAGYYGNPQASSDTIKDGWLLTGDIGFYNEDGYLFIHDRLKELIKYKAFQVAPAQLEAALLTHPGVQDVAVIGVPDEEAGEVPRAFIVPVEGNTPTEEDVMRFVKERVSSYKQLRGGVRLIQAIPKSASGKILRRVLRET